MLKMYIIWAIVHYREFYITESDFYGSIRSKYKLEYKFDISLRKKAEIELPDTKIPCSAQSC